MTVHLPQAPGFPAEGEPVCGRACLAARERELQASVVVPLRSSDAAPQRCAQQKPSPIKALAQLNLSPMQAVGCDRIGFGLWK